MRVSDGVLSPRLPRPLPKKPRIKAGFQKSAAVVAHENENSEGSESNFELALMPVNKIRRRELHQHSVHYSLPSSCWIATIMRLDHRPGDSRPRSPYVQYEFATEGEAKKFCKAYSPPKMVENAVKCFTCDDPFSAKSRQFNCRNCGVCVCEKCSTRWSSRMIPKTYLNSACQPQVVRVCSSCQWLSNAFCLALLKGSYHDALEIQATGNVNLRSSFASIGGESMFPVHCCTLGGNLELLKWLVDKQLCPISVKRDSKTGKMLSVKTSNNRTLLDLAMTGKPKLDILMYLVAKGLSMYDLADSSLTTRTLEALLTSGIATGGMESTIMNNALAMVECSEGSVCTVENACTLCCDKTMDCVLSPCGHMLGCSDCCQKLETCPMCKVKCKVLSIIHC